MLVTLRQLKPEQPPVVSTGTRRKCPSKSFRCGRLTNSDGNSAHRDDASAMTFSVE